MYEDSSLAHVANEAKGDFLFLTSVDHSSIVLSISSGWGSIELAFAKTAKQVYALNTTLAESQLISVRAREEGIDNITSIIGDAAEIPLSPGSCDIVLMGGALARIPWRRDNRTPRDLQKRMLDNVFRVLKPGGQLFIGIENRFSIKNFLGFREPHTKLRFLSLMPRWLADLYSRIARHAPMRVWTYSRRELRQLLMTSGFRQIREFYPLPSYPDFRFITDFSEPWLTWFLANSYRGFGSFSRILRAGALVVGLLRIEKTLAPCFSFIAEKGVHD